MKFDGRQNRRIHCLMLQGSVLEVMQVSPLGCSPWEKHPHSLSSASAPNAAVLTASTQEALGRFPAVVDITASAQCLAQSKHSAEGSNAS